ncbi:MAG: hypothetical protein OHK0013_17850 [Sandaracinaceae bacterium]
MSAATLVLLAWAWSAAALLGCGGAGPTTDRSPPRVDLEAVIPDGAETVVRLRPRELLASSDLATVARALVSDEALDAFSERHGVDPRTLEALVLATYGERTAVVLLSGPFIARVVVGEIGHRMSPLESSADAPIYRRAGVYLRRRFELLALGAHELALIDGPPALSGRIVARVSRPEAPSPPADGGNGVPALRLRTILEGEQAAPFVLVRHGRPELPPAGVGLLLARMEDAVLTLSPGDPGSVIIRARLFGEFPPGAEENFRTLVASLSDTDLGRALGFEEIARALAIEVVGSEIRLTASVRSQTLARGLRLFGGAGLAELLEPPPG